MGYSYTMSGALCCDACDSSHGVRKVPCPHKWCQPAALCATCRKTYKPKLEGHAGCAEASAAFAARLAQEAAIKAAGGYVRRSAYGIGPGPLATHVIFQGATDSLGFRMAEATYSAIPNGTPATPDDYRKHGPLTPAPASFY